MTDIVTSCLADPSLCGGGDGDGFVAPRKVIPVLSSVARGIGTDVSFSAVSWKTVRYFRGVG